MLPEMPFHALSSQRQCQQAKLLILANSSTLGRIVYLPQTGRGKSSNARLLTNLLHT